MFFCNVNLYGIHYDDVEKGKNIIKWSKYMSMAV
jgi:hypothetical protein